ncbi:hypothetical protein ACWEOW_12185 [Monashia sp. NPDC004114]
MTRRRLASLLAAMAALAGAAIAVAWAVNAVSGPVIQLPPGAPLNHIVEGFGYVGPRTHVHDSEVMLCLSEPGSVKVISVEPINPIGQIKVEDFGFRPNPFLTSPPGKMLGSGPGTLAQSGATWLVAFPAAV